VSVYAITLLRERALKPMATHEIPITGLYGCHNAMKDETVQDDCREGGGDGMGEVVMVTVTKNKVGCEGRAMETLAEMGASLPVLHPDKFEYSRRPLNDPVPAESLDVNQLPATSYQATGRWRSYSSNKWLASPDEVSCRPLNDLPLSETMTSTMNLVIAASPLKYVPATSYKRIDLSSQLIYFRLIIIMAPLSCIRQWERRHL
jgi:hypothetical protein